MTDITAITARRFSDLHPGFDLVHAVEAAIPVSWLTLELLAQERKPLPVVDEFVLRLANRGINNVAEIAAILGLDDETINTAIVEQLSAETIDYSPNYQGARLVALTAAGKRAVTDLVLTTPQRIDQAQAFDRLLWEPVQHNKSDLITRADAQDQDMVLLPSQRTRDVIVDDVTARALNRLLERTHRGRELPVEVLTVESIGRQRRRFQSAVLLIFGAAEFDDVRLSLVVDGSTSDAYDRALAELGVVDSLGIGIEPPAGEPLLPEEIFRQRISYDAVRNLQRRVDASSVRTHSEAGPSEEGRSDDSATARAELENLSVRSVPVFEHRELLVHAIANANRRFLLVTPSVTSSAVNEGMISQLERLLRRRGLIAHIAYGVGNADSFQDDPALERLRDLARRFGNLTIAPLRDVHPSILVFDDTWVNSSFPWLSYRGTPSHTYRNEEGTLIRSMAIVNERYSQYKDLIDEG